MMAFFGTSEDENDEEQPYEKDQSVDQSDNVKAKANAQSRQFSVLKQPRITEKATRLADEENVYTFVVKEDANKKEIEQAVANYYDVTPVDVRTAAIPKKKIRQMRESGGEKGGGKKAYVKLQEGDSIELL